MITYLSLVASVALLVGGASAQTQSQYGQCGGIGWSGPTLCPSGWSCQKLNDYYSQCLPGSATPTPTTTSNPGSPPVTTLPPTTTNNPGATPTLAPGYSFIRAVEDPNFHKYLRSEVSSTASDAVLGEPVDAAQFQITGGQLVQNANGKSLYAIVEAYTGADQKKLQVTWSATPSTSGAFSWSGDTVLWHDPNVPRPQDNAWLVCPDADGNRDLYINLGPYSYQTPAGCADETIHAYTGSTPTD
ncbi:hypothetical protein AGABI2DRAFT_194858 [Agaricus bisporus var. bisporus H97]|uniref:hypothetical protein n=1 Tax=Agaricus bisporus var. bisporus (strain H97 / ATCC MYA-4626 / FGSC 10389) TaxID=936046 RepID=UPI00029F68EE|nr:hypothetical protein AGABI2DRAFT_194858 [Agaricus bisporus var. bisporus H97]EKV43944.1 hypothetical protein AGABI2DRAFT_194858 [Agaricus bisporus var. bisporus H97]